MTTGFSDECWWCNTSAPAHQPTRTPTRVEVRILARRANAHRGAVFLAGEPVGLGQLASQRLQRLQRLQRGHDPAHHLSGDALAVHRGVLGLHGSVGPGHERGRRTDAAGFQPGRQIPQALIPRRTNAATTCVLYFEPETQLMQLDLLSLCWIIS
jgi:hypothetical protein